MEDLDALRERARTVLLANGFSEEDIQNLLDPVEVVEEFEDVDPEETVFEDVTEMLAAIREYVRATRDKIVPDDDPRLLRIGFGNRDGSRKWRVPLGILKMWRPSDPVLGEMFRTIEGRHQLAAILTTAGRSDPPPPRVVPLVNKKSTPP
jgi:hypothetical protein